MNQQDRTDDASRREPPPPGALDRDGEVSFTLYAPGKRSVHLIGDFNDWHAGADPMEQVDEGWWSVTKDLPRGTFAYQFLIDDELVLCDPYARLVKEEPGDRPRKAIVKPRQDPYEWRHDDWLRPRFEDLILYELHIADFTPQRDFREAVDRLDYVRDLGVNCIELMPIFGVQENKGWGYTPTYLFAPNEDYGTPDELRWLIDEAHGKGIGVVLDMVLAHTGEKHPFNRMYPYEESPWYGPGVEGGNEYGLPQLDYAKPATRRFAGDVLQYWLREYHVDGFRFDYVKNIGTTPDGHGNPTLTRAARSLRPDAYLIGEHLPEDPGEMLEADMDGSWHVRFSYAVKALLCECEIGGYRWDDFASAALVLDPAAEGYAERPTCMVNYLESHDEERVIREVTQAGFDEHTARRKGALGATVLFTTVGEPMLYHGQAWGEDTPKNMDHNYLEWEDLSTAGGKGLRDHFARMARFRMDHDSLRTANFSLDAVWAERKCLAYHRWNDVGEEIVVAANFSGETRRVGVPLPRGGRWRELFTQAEIETDGSADVEIDPYAARVFRKL